MIKKKQRPFRRPALRLTAVFLLVLAAPCTPVSGTGPAAADPLVRASEQFRLGADAYRAGKYRDALKHFGETLRLGGNPGIIYYNMAGCYYRLGDNGRALSCYRRVTEAAPEFLNGWVNYGKLCFSLNAPGDALQAFRRALHLQPDNLQLLLLTGDCYAACGAAGDAFLYYERARREHPAAAAPYLSLVNLYISIRDYRTAITLLEQGAGLVKQREQLYRYMGELYRTVQEWGKAGAALEQALMHTPVSGREELYRLLADSSLRNGQPFLAVDALERALREDGRRLSLRFMLAEIFQSQGFDHEAGRQLLAAAAQDFYRTRNRLYNLAVLYYNRREFREAAALCRSVLQLHAGDPVFLKLARDIQQQLD